MFYILMKKWQWVIILLKEINEGQCNFSDDTLSNEWSIIEANALGLNIICDFALYQQWPKGV